MSSYDEYMASLRITPGSIVQILPDGHDLPVVLDLSPGAPRKPGTFQCLNCGHDPYEPVDPFVTVCRCCLNRRDRHVER